MIRPRSHGDCDAYLEAATVSNNNNDNNEHDVLFTPVEYLATQPL